MSQKKSNIGKNIHDTFTKKILSNPNAAKEFFELNLPKNILSEIDLSTLRQEKESYVDHELGYGIVDLLFSVDFGEDKGYLMLLLEHQSTEDYNMSVRISKYILRFISDYLDKHGKKKVPLIYPLLYYTGKKKYSEPLSIYDLFINSQKAKEYLTKPIQLIEVTEFEKEDFKGKLYAGMFMYCMSKIHERDIFPYIKDLYHEIRKLSEQGDIEYIKTMVYYVIERADSKKINEIFEEFGKAVSTTHKEAIMTIAERLRNQGMQKGIEAGMQKGIEAGIQKGIETGMEKGKEAEKKNIATTLLLKNLDDKTIAEYTGLSIATIKELRKN